MKLHFRKIPVLALSLAAVVGSALGIGCGDPPPLGDEGKPCNEEGATKVVPYSGPENTIDVGTCHGGVLICKNGVFAVQTDEVTPAAEDCHSNLAQDNNCDNVPDTIVCEHKQPAPQQTRYCRYACDKLAASTGACPEYADDAHCQDP
jgi:hypothetical protein